MAGYLVPLHIRGNALLTYLRSGLVVAATVFALLAPVGSQARPADTHRTIGYLARLCSGGGDGSSAITAAGYTAIPLTTADAASLANLDGLLYINCIGETYLANSAINAAVANGMVLMMHDLSPMSGSRLPGGEGLQVQSLPEKRVDLPAGSPASAGPGGAVNVLVDPYYFTHRGAAVASSLPIRSIIIANAFNPGGPATFAYTYGQGRVVYSTVPINVFVTGGSGFSADAGSSVRAFATNLIAWSMSEPVVPLATPVRRIGYLTRTCSGSNASSAIIAAGHVPVPLATADAVSLVGLGGLLYINCGGTYLANRAIDKAVANGMSLIMHDLSIGSGGTVYGSQVPGGAGLEFNSQPGKGVDLPAGSPAANGPGGGVASLVDPYGGYFVHRGVALPASLPAGSVVVGNSSGYPSGVATFAYRYGRGQVVFGSVPISQFTSGGTAVDQPLGRSMRAFEANLIAWAVRPSFTTCAAEGYLGTKLKLCRSICEVTQSSTTLTREILLYTKFFHEAPPCGR